MPTPENSNELRLEKQRLRQFATDQRSGQPNKTALSQVICNTLTTMAEYQEAGTICSYVGVGDEVLTVALLQNALAQGKRIAVPYVRRHRLALFHLQSLDDLQPAPFGLLEPAPQLRQKKELEVDPADIDLYLVPGLAFGVKGERLGHGKGYYDGLLHDISDRVLKFGICFLCQLIEDIPMSIQDVHMNRIITEKGVYTDCH
jgi:5-formyltetrahydrofolate cyclo-ligase